MGGWKKRSAIDVGATFIHKVKEKWPEKNLAVALFINVKKAFNYILKDQFIR